jgi:hypothetical protein
VRLYANVKAAAAAAAQLDYVDFPNVVDGKRPLTQIRFTNSNDDVSKTRVRKPWPISTKAFY